MKRSVQVMSGRPDLLMNELVAALTARTWFEFKPLFLVVHAGLRQRNAARVGEEMLRLRVYDKLQGLVRLGNVERVGKTYRGRLPALTAFAEQLSAGPAYARPALACSTK